MAALLVSRPAILHCGLDAIEKQVDDVFRTPQDVVARARVLLGAQNR